MSRILIIAGALWFAFAAVFVLALMAAAKRGLPPEIQARPDPSRSTITPMTLRNSNEIPEQEPAILTGGSESVAARPEMALASMEPPLHASD